MDPDCKWTIPGSLLLSMFRRVSQGEDPDVLYAELYANAEHTYEGDNAEEA